MNLENQKSIVLEVANCPLCGHGEGVPVLEGEDRLYQTVPEGVRCTLIGCNACSMKYLNPRVSKADIGKFYPVDEYYTRKFSQNKELKRKFLDDLGRAQARSRHHYPANVAGFTSGLHAPVIWIMSKVAVLLNPFRFRRLLPYLPDGKVFELGFGNGFYLLTLADLGWECWGAEMESATVTLAREYGIAAFSDYMASDIPESQFDWVTSYHALEHVYDPVSALKRMYDLLKPGGRIFLGVPNGDSVVARIFGPYWYNLGIPIHIQLFSPRTLETALKQAGFVDIRLRSWSLTQGLLGSIQFSINEYLWRATGRKRTSTVLQDSRLAQLLALPLIKILDVLGQGDAIEVVARKPLK